MTYLGIAGIALAAMFQGAFTLEDDGQALTVLEADKPVLVYLYQPGELPRLVRERYKRACYIHPLYGLDGEEMTQDFPIDHFHHRGVFWSWPDSTLGERKINVWALDGARHVHAEFISREADDERAEIAVVNHWVFDDAPDTPVVREEVRIVVSPARENSRDIDFELTFTNVADELFTLRGAEADDKGYGGFCLRPDATRRPMQFTSAQGPQPEDEDALVLDTPWVDVSYATAPGGDIRSGAAIFQHPENPGYPHNGWILRHYGFLGQSWPHIAGHEMQPGDAVTLRYRLHLHRGDAQTANVAQAFEQYLREVAEE